MSINEIGQSLVECRLNCDGIENNPKERILPRCLILEDPKGLGTPQCIIVGINPGHSRKRERKYYKENELSYNTTKEYFERKISKLKYFKILRNFAKEIGLGESILWTDLCKCENKIKESLPPLQTFRTCIKKFLKKELEVFPNIPIIAVGNQSFNALCYMYPDRFIIGIPHPTGTKNTLFNQLFENNDIYGELKKEYKKRLKNRKDRNGNPKCIRLFPKNKKL